MHLKRFVAYVLVLAVALVGFGLAIGADAHLFESPQAYALAGEVHVFDVAGRLASLTIRGTNSDGFAVDTVVLDSAQRVIRVDFPADSSAFDVLIRPAAVPPPSVYSDSAPIVAISDIESGLGALRDFLVSHQIADRDFNWRFGRGHLVFVGDFVDRGASTTQVLWAAYKLEGSAREAGGHVHFVIGNHEIKNLQGNFQTANEKYFHIAGMLGKRQDELFSDSAVLGQWLASKNVVEVINQVAFVHGGLHPALARWTSSVQDLNDIVRAGYRQPWFTPRRETAASFLRSNNTGPAWYRGYFKDKLTAAAVDSGLQLVGARHVVVGHTLQGRVNVRHNGRVIAIDVPHRKDYLTSFPPRFSEGVMVRDGTFSRLLENGQSRPLSTR